MLTPQDIETKVFKKGFRGYSVKAVENFLLEVADCYEKLYKENLAANDRILMLSDAVIQYRSMESTMQTSTTAAKEAAQDTTARIEQQNTERIEQTIGAESASQDTAELAVAEVQADEILKQAETQAAEMIAKAERETAQMTYQYEQMKRSVEVFRAKVVALLQAQLEIIKDYSEIQIDEETLREAKRLYEEGVSAAEQQLAQVARADRTEADATAV